MTLEKSLAWFIAAITAILLVSLYANIGRGEEIAKPGKSAESNIVAGECPAGEKTCKVLTLTDEQVKTLKIFIENTSVSGPYAQIKQAVEFYERLLDSAPAGKPVEKK